MEQVPRHIAEWIIKLLVERWVELLVMAVGIYGWRWWVGKNFSHQLKVLQDEQQRMRASYEGPLPRRTAPPLGPTWISFSQAAVDIKALEFSSPTGAALFILFQTYHADAVRGEMPKEIMVNRDVWVWWISTAVLDRDGVPPPAG